MARAVPISIDAGAEVSRSYEQRRDTEEIRPLLVWRCKGVAEEISSPQQLWP